MCEACDSGNQILITLLCDSCNFRFYIVDEPNKIEDLTCPSCRVGTGIEWSDESGD